MNASTIEVTVAKDFTFDAAHRLPNHSGKCQNLHGHTYRVRFEVTGPVQPSNGNSDEGMVVDFGTVKAIWRDALEPLLDHRFLNESIGAEVGPTTAENMAGWLFAKMDKELPLGVKLSAVSLWETPTSFVRVVGGE